ncbi:MAG: FUSC family protein [Clostridium sp.]
MLGINKKSMLRHGGIGVFVMVTIIFIWGFKYSIIAFPMAMTSLALSKQNITIKPISKALHFMLIYSLIVTFSFIASRNPYIGIPINFVCLFSIGYFLTVRFNPVFYKPFLMLYVFTSFGEPSLPSLITKIIIVNYGVIVVVLIERLIYKENNKNLLINNIISSLSNVQKLIYESDKTKKRELLLSNLNKIRGMWYTLYITRYKKSLTTKLGKIQFDVLLNIQKLNFYCFDNDFSEWESSFMISDLKMIEDFNYTFSSPIAHICEEIQNDIFLIKSLTNKESKKLSSDFKKSELDTFSYLIKNDFKVGSIRMNFGLRLAIVLTISLFLGNVLSYYKIVWVSITIMSIIYPYYEDTLSRIGQRVKGNIIGIILISIVLSFNQSETITFLIMIASVMLIYGFKDYEKLSLFATISSLASASFITPVNELAILRILYVIIGAVIVYLANRFLFPYKLEHGVSHLVRNILRLNSLLASELLNFSNRNINLIGDTVILTNLYLEKLYLRNLQLNLKEIEDFILTNTRLLNRLSSYINPNSTSN